MGVLNAKAWQNLPQYFKNMAFVKGGMQACAHAPKLVCDFRLHDDIADITTLGTFTDDNTRLMQHFFSASPAGVEQGAREQCWQVLMEHRDDGLPVVWVFIERFHAHQHVRDLGMEEPRLTLGKAFDQRLCQPLTMDIGFV